VKKLTVLEVRNLEVVTVGEPGPKGDQGDPGGDSLIAATASEAMSAYRAVVADSASGVSLADNTDITHRDRVLGITENAAATAGPVDVRRSGEITFASWAWTPYAPIFVGAAGLLTQTAPVNPAVFSQVIAVALSATVIYVWPREPLTII
jgi:hypothetical protein